MKNRPKEGYEIKDILSCFKSERYFDEEWKDIDALELIVCVYRKIKDKEQF